MYIPCQLVGIFARSPELIRATREFDRGRCTKEELEKIRKKEVEKLVECQKEFEYITDGKLLWQDLLRPFMLARGIEEGPLTRFFKTNTFYRKPIIKGKIEFDPSLIEKFFYLPLIHERKKVSLPGPIAFLSLSEDRYKRDSLLQIAELLKAVSEWLEKKEVALIEFLEPGITLSGELRLFKKAYEVITENLKVDTSIHTYFTDFSKIIELLDFPVDGIGIDFIATSLDDLKFTTQKRIGIGCIDSQNSLLEEEKEVVDFARNVIKKLKLKSFYLSPNCDFDFLPYSVAIEKLKVLRKASRKLCQK